MNRQGHSDVSPRKGRRRGLRAARIAGWILLPLLLLSLYLGFIGLPPSLFQRWIRDLEQRGVYVSLDRVRLDLARGVVVDGLRLYDAPARSSSILDIDKIKVALNPLDWLGRRPGLRTVRIRDATLRIHSPAAGAAAPTRHLVMDRVNARLDVQPDGIRLARLNMALLGMVLRGTGFLALEMQPTGAPRAPPRDLARMLSESLQKIPPWLPRFLEQANAVEYVIPPQARIDFAVYPTNPGLTEAQFEVQGGETKVRGVSFDRWNARVRLENGTLSVPVLALVSGRRRCDATGSMDFGDGTAKFRAFSDLEPSSWLKLIPMDWRDRLEQENFSFQGPGSFEVWGGPARLDRMAGRLAGWVSLDKARLRGVWVEKGFLSFKKEQERVMLEKVEATLGRGSQAGLVRGTAAYQFDTREFSARAVTDFDPNALLPVLGPSNARVVRSLVFGPKPPHTELEVGGVVGQPRKLRMNGHLWGTNFTYNGAAVSHCESTMSVKDGIMVMDPIRVFRPEGSAEGRLVVDFDHQIVDVEATNTADPYAVGLIIGPAVGKFLRNFRFEGPTRVVAKGRVDYGTWQKTDLEGYVEGERMGMSWLLADRCSFRVRAIGPKVEFTEARGLLFGGAFSGTAVFDRVNEPTNVSYHVAGAAVDVDFSRLAQSLGAPETKVYEGLLSGNANVSGIVGEGRGDTAVGEGTVSIKQGHLFQIPLLGDLTKVLSRLYPGVRLITQTDFQSSFTIGQREVHSEDIALEGMIVSISGKGTYTFNQKLDMNVQVQLLREGPFASVLRLVTFPVTKLLEFHLGGSLKNPKWRPVNFPKEFFLIFD
ncbi:MAG: AsmA-like C-terminal region-containing protein [Verrucomicrobiota bacterium]